MRDFYELPGRASFGLFLIRDPNALNLGNLNKLQVEGRGFVLSLERLFKNSKSALVLYAPKDLIAKFPDFKPLELLDYSRAYSKAYSKDKASESGEVWRQFVIQPDKDFFRVLKRELEVVAKMDPEQLSDFRKRKITPLGSSTIKMTSEQLLKAILLPR